MSDQFRDLTAEESLLVPVFFDDAYFDLANNLYKASWGNHFLRSDDLKLPWIFTLNDQEISKEDLEDTCPGYNCIKQLESRTLIGEYQHKGVYWSSKEQAWTFNNHKEVIFSDSDEPESEDEPNSESEQAEVSQLIESATKAVTSAASKSSRPQTPSTSTPHTPQTLPGALPVTPGPSTQQGLPTPTATVLPPRIPSPSFRSFPPLPPPSQPSPLKGKTPVRSAQNPKPSTNIPVTTAQTQTPTVPPVITTTSMTTPANKIIGSPPSTL
jgi:hypothetical protein